MFAMGDRYSYVPSIGLFIMLAWGAATLLQRFSLGKPLGIACAVLVLTTMAVVTRLNLAHWRNSETLFRHALALTENNFVANYALGAELTEQGRFDEAEPYLAEAVRLMPEEVRGHKTLGHALYAQGKLEGAYACYERVERLDPGNGSALFTMGIILEKLGRPEEAARRHAKAIASFRAAVAALPGDPHAAANLEAALEHAKETAQ
jgi:tetratricopeptide (TPR) repeat protein